MLKALTRFILGVPSGVLGIIGFIFSIFFITSTSAMIGFAFYRYIPKEFLVSFFGMFYNNIDILSSHILHLAVYISSGLGFYILYKNNEDFRMFISSAYYNLFRYLIISYGFAVYITILLYMDNNWMDYFLVFFFPVPYTIFLFTNFYSMKKFYGKVNLVSFFRSKLGLLEYFASIYSLAYFLVNIVVRAGASGVFGSSNFASLASVNFMEAASIYIILLTIKFLLDYIIITVRSWSYSEDS